MKEMKLIADAGSTKTAWALVNARSGEQFTSTRGCNAMIAPPGAVTDSLAAAIAAFGCDRLNITSIEWYGAGCATDEVCGRVADELGQFCPEAAIHVGSDLEGAARAVFGSGQGIACILGTGSNSGLYDGRTILMNVPPLGYILGDEGSGAALGKRLVADALRGMLDDELKTELERDYGVTKANVLERVYRQSGGNAFLASIVPFLARHRDNEAVRHILIEVFSSFFERNIDLYPECRSHRLGFVGSVALHFEKELKEVAAAMGYFIDTIIGSPIEALAGRALNSLKS